MTQTGESSSEPYYIVAHSAASLEHSRVLRQGDAFALLDPFGDIPGQGDSEAYGLFHAGTRYLSRSWMTFSGQRLMLLGSHMNTESGTLRVAMTNADLLHGGRVAIPRESMHLERHAFLWRNCLREAFRAASYCTDTIRSVLRLEFAADFADVFEVRGARRQRRGEVLATEVSNRTVIFRYRGLDDKVRSTRISFNPAPAKLAAGTVEFNLSLPPGGAVEFELCVECDESDKAKPLLFADALKQRATTKKHLSTDGCSIATDNALCNRWLNQSLSDVRLMLTEKPEGPYPLAGVPWYSTEFGRDALITAMELLWLEPSIARGVLAFLAEVQATEIDSARVAEPGKIVHEIRRGEMANLREVPFGRYYGSVDSTPLFVMLASAYHDRTNDIAFLHSIWPAVERALKWIDDYGDADRDGFVEYRPHPDGLRNQGWKDASDSVFHQDGSLAEGSIALCEVQGYVYAAKAGAARLAKTLGHTNHAVALERQAAELKSSFHQHFWSEQLNAFVIALDGRKHRCEIASSNSLQCLFTEIVGREEASKMAVRAFEPDFFSGWGIRTLARGQPRYNPMSYHNGSVWPHDNALIAWGLAKYGFVAEAGRILTAMHDLATYLPLGRLPELICGFERRPEEGPTLYPVACSPQAWSAGSVFLLIQAILGLSVAPLRQQILFSRPIVPQVLGAIRISNLAVGDGSLDVTLSAGQDQKEGTSVAVIRRSGQAHCVTTS